MYCIEEMFGANESSDTEMHELLSASEKSVGLGFFVWELYL